MPKINEFIDSLNDEVITPDTKGALKTEVNALLKQNSQLYQRAKKAEGFEYDKDTKKWTKREAPTTNSTPKETVKSGELDYGHLAFFNTNSDSIKIGNADEEYLKKTIEDTGKSQKELLGSKWFLTELKEKQESRTVKDAVPSSTKRSAPSGKGNVEYWLQKPFDEVPKEMRREVLDARVKIETEGSKFSDNPVIVS